MLLTFTLFFLFEETPPTNFVVTLDCRNDLARSRYLPACRDVDLFNQRTACELRGPADTMALNAVAALSGEHEVERHSSHNWAQILNIYFIKR